MLIIFLSYLNQNTDKLNRKTHTKIKINVKPLVFERHHPYNHCILLLPLLYTEYESDRPKRGDFRLPSTTNSWNLLSTEVSPHFHYQKSTKILNEPTFNRFENHPKF